MVITAALYEEVSGIISRIEKQVISNAGGRKLISGNIKGRQVSVLITGMGIVNAVQALTALIESSNPSLIINTGCAGVFRETGLNIGDIGVASEEIDVQFGIEPEKDDQPVQELSFPVLSLKGHDIRNRYPLDQNLADTALSAIRSIINDKNISVEKGPFVTVSTVTATDRRAALLHQHFSAYMESMEGSGLAHVAIYYGIPFLEVRSASNITGKRDISTWNFDLAFERCALAVIACLEILPDLD